MGLGITIANSEIKDIIKVINSLEKKRIFIEILIKLLFKKESYSIFLVQ